MPASYAHVPTSRAGRYLAQLCSHGRLMSRLARHRPPGHGQAQAQAQGQGQGEGQGHGDGHGTDGAPPVATASSAGTEGMIDFGWGRCTLRATAGALTLHAEAGDPQRLRQIEDGISARLQRIGRRDQLTVAWTDTPPATGAEQETRS